MWLCSAATTRFVITPYERNRKELLLSLLAYDNYPVFCTLVYDDLRTFFGCYTFDTYLRFSYLRSCDSATLRPGRHSYYPYSSPHTYAATTVVATTRILCFARSRISSMMWW